MNNQLCIDKKRLIELFLVSNAKKTLNSALQKFWGRFSLVEIYEQMKAEKGEVEEYYKGELKKFSGKNINNEFSNAITLAEFYFPNSNPLICFEMKSDFIKKDVETCQELAENIESYTDVDCLIKDQNEGFKFQLKQYPEEYKEWSPAKVIEYLEKSVISEKKYNNEANKDLIIAITIKPERQSNFREEQDFQEIHEYLKGENIKLKEINFLYNRNNESMIWFQVFPGIGYNAIPWQKLSYHGAKK